MDVNIQIRISVDTAHGVFNDALYLTLEQYDTLTEQEIQAMKDERLTNWINSMLNPVPHAPLTEEELLAQQINLQLQLQQVEEQLQEIVE